MTRIALALICAFASAARADVSIPADKRIASRVTRHLAAPADAPMHMPTDVAVDQHNRVYVADGVNHRVVRFSVDGALDAKWAPASSLQLMNPVGLAVDAQDRLWIADADASRIVVVSNEGALIEKIDLPARDDAHPFQPTDVAVTPDAKRAYMVDNENHRVVIRDNSAGTLTVMGRFGESLGQFQWPFMVALGPDGYAYVTEAIGARVQRISPSDQWAGGIGRWGVALGQLYRPKGVVADAKGRVYVSDSTLGAVQVFESRGGLLGVLTEDAGRPIRFQHPMGLALDGRGLLYVVELRADRVAVVELPEGFGRVLSPSFQEGADRP